MATPVPDFVQPAPYGIELEPGKDYWFCACGKSKSQPFCDGSHKGSGMAPIKFSVSEKKKYYLCGCKLSATMPFCDGTHKQEKGIKKYNEFLLKKNNEFKDKLTALEKKNRLMGLATVASGVAALAVLVYVRFQS